MRENRSGFVKFIVSVVVFVLLVVVSWGDILRCSM